MAITDPLHEVKKICCHINFLEASLGALMLLFWQWEAHLVPACRGVT